jgi:hypothetical protein
MLRVSEQDILNFSGGTIKKYPLGSFVALLRPDGPATAVDARGPSVD